MYASLTLFVIKIPYLDTQLVTANKFSKLGRKEMEKATALLQEPLHQILVV